MTHRARPLLDHVPVAHRRRGARTLAVRAGVEGIEWGADGHVAPGGGPAVEALRAAVPRRRRRGRVVRLLPRLRARRRRRDAARSTPCSTPREALGAPMVRIWTELGVSPASPADDRRRVTERTARVRRRDRGARPRSPRSSSTRTRSRRPPPPPTSCSTTLARPNLRTHWQPDPALARRRRARGARAGHAASRARARLLLGPGRHRRSPRARRRRRPLAAGARARRPRRRAAARPPLRAVRVRPRRRPRAARRRRRRAPSLAGRAPRHETCRCTVTGLARIRSANVRNTLRPGRRGNSKMLRTDPPVASTGPEMGVLDDDR